MNLFRQLVVGVSASAPRAPFTGTIVCSLTAGSFLFDNAGDDEGKCLAQTHTQHKQIGPKPKGAKNESTFSLSYF